MKKKLKREKKKKKPTDHPQNRLPAAETVGEEAAESNIKLRATAWRSVVFTDTDDSVVFSRTPNDKMGLDPGSKSIKIPLNP